MEGSGYFGIGFAAAFVVVVWVIVGQAKTGRDKAPIRQEQDVGCLFRLAAFGIAAGGAAVCGYAILVSMARGKVAMWLPLPLTAFLEETGLGTLGLMGAWCAAVFVTIVWSLSHNGRTIECLVGYVVFGTLCLLLGVSIIAGTPGIMDPLQGVMQTGGMS